MATIEQIAQIKKNAGVKATSENVGILRQRAKQYRIEQENASAYNGYKDLAQKVSLNEQNWKTGKTDTQTYLTLQDGYAKEAKALRNQFKLAGETEYDTTIASIKNALSDIIANQYVHDNTLKYTSIDGTRTPVYNTYKEYQQEKSTQYKSYQEQVKALEEQIKFLEDKDNQAYARERAATALTEEEFNKARAGSMGAMQFGQFKDYGEYLASLKNVDESRRQKDKSYLPVIAGPLETLALQTAYGVAQSIPLESGDGGVTNYWNAIADGTLLQERKRQLASAKKLEETEKIEEKYIRGVMAEEVKKGRQMIEDANNGLFGEPGLVPLLASTYAENLGYVSPELQKKFYAILAQDADAAIEYYKAYEDVVNQWYGKEFADAIKDGSSAWVAIKELSLAGISGLVGWGRRTAGLFGQSSPTYWEYAYSEVRGDEGFLERSVGDALWTLALDLVNNFTGNMVGYAVGGAVGKVAGRSIGSTVGAATLGFSAGAGAYADAIREGYSPAQALAYGTMIGISESSLEHLLGGIAGVSSGKIEDLASGLFSKLSSTTGRTAIGIIGRTVKDLSVRYGADIVGEFTEEYLQDILEPVFRNICFNENNEFKFFTEDALYSGLLGALSAAGMGAPRLVSSIRASAKANLFLNAEGMDGVRSVLQDLVANPTNEAMRQFAEELSAKADNGTLNLEDIGYLLAFTGAQMSTEGRLRLITEYYSEQGYKVNYVDTMTDSLEQEIGGEINKDTKTITINRSAPNPMWFVFKHEFVHSIEKSPKYVQFRNFVFDSAPFRERLMKVAQTDNFNDALNNVITGYIDSYQKRTGKTIDRVSAEKEVLADFVGTYMFTDLAFAERIVGKYPSFGKMLKSMFNDFRVSTRGTTEEKFFRKAEKLFRMAERSSGKDGIEFQKEIEAYSQAPDPTDSANPINTTAEAITEENIEETQNSMASLFDAIGFDQYSREEIIRDTGKTIADFKKAIKEGKITEDTIKESKLGKILRIGLERKIKAGGNETELTEKYNKDIRLLYDLATFIGNHADAELRWQIAGSMIFSCVTKNSDPQYTKTLDFGTICKKTQALINMMSDVMKREGRGLEKEEILALYREAGELGYETPCNGCYVFQRWVGIGSRLDQIRDFQNRWKGTTYEEALAIVKSVKEEVDEKRGKKDFSDFRPKLAEQYRKEGNTQRADEIDAYSYFLATIVNYSKKNGYSRYMVNGKKVDTLPIVPLDILYDLNNADDFAFRYPGAWKFRTTGGPAMGKAIQGYTEARAGETLLGLADPDNFKDGKRGTAFIPGDTAKSKKAANDLWNTASRKVKAENLTGGFRTHSTTDFRFDYALDYIIAFMELDAIGANVQLYTKVQEGVDFLCSAGADVNLSVWSKGKGYATDGNGNPILDENGNAVLEFSNTQGMNIDAATYLQNKYVNAQKILVGMNDIVIKSACAGNDIFFVIPYHASGGQADFVAALAVAVGEDTAAEYIQDYTSIQNDKENPNATEEQVRLRELRKLILTGKLVVDGKRNHPQKAGQVNLSEEDMRIIESSEIVNNLLGRFYGYTVLDGKLVDADIDEDCYRVTLPSDTADHILPFEYWDKTSTIENADINGTIFVDYCDSLGLIPRFSGETFGNFSGKDGDTYTPIKGYWKLLIDRPMYNLAYNPDGTKIDGYGTYRAQKKIDMSNVSVDMLDVEHQVADQNLRSKYRAVSSLEQIPTRIEEIRDVLNGDYDNVKDKYNSVISAMAQVYHPTQKAVNVADYADTADPVQAAVTSDAYTQYSIDNVFAPEKVTTAYKLFIAKDGKLYPPKVANPEGQPTPLGVWLRADIGGAHKENGLYTLNSDGRLQVNALDKDGKPTTGTLAFRPGWHTGPIPMATQFYRTDENGKKTLLPGNFVWAKVEIPADKDYQLEAMSIGINKSGKFVHSRAGLPYVPYGGSYVYRTNANPNTMPWYISGQMMVTEILDDSDVQAILDEYGLKAPNRTYPLDLEALGLKRGRVTPSTEEYSLSTEEIEEAKRITEAVRQRWGLEEGDGQFNGYSAHEIDFSDPNIREEFRMNGQDIEYYAKLAADTNNGYLEQTVPDVQYSMDNVFAEKVVELPIDNELQRRIGDKTGSEKYKVIARYIRETLGDSVTFQDGLVAVMDKSDANHIAHDAATKKTAWIAAVRELIDSAKIYAYDDNVDHNKFDLFVYYMSNANYDGEQVQLFFNVGRGKYDLQFHLYDITNRINKDTAHRVNDVGRPRRFLPKNGVSANSIAQDRQESQYPGENIFSSESQDRTQSSVFNVFTDAEAQKEIQRLLNPLVDEYGAFEPGEDPQGNNLYVSVPIKDSRGDNVSRFARTAMESRVVPNEMKPEVAKDIIDGALSYVTTSNEKNVARARDSIDKIGYDKAYTNFKAMVEENRFPTSVDIAKGELLLAEAAKRGNVAEVQVLIANLAALGSQSGQVVQALSLLKRLTPEGRLYYLERATEKINSTIPTRTKARIASRNAEQIQQTDNDIIEIDKAISWTQELIAEQEALEAAKSDEKALAEEELNEAKQDLRDAKRDVKRIERKIEKLKAKIAEFMSKVDSENKNLDDAKQVLSTLQLAKQKLQRIKRSLQGQVTLTDEETQYILESKDADELDTRIQEVSRMVANRVPVGFLQKWNTWRYLCMLFNPLTHIRNIVGNALMVPVVYAKDFVASILQNRLNLESNAYAVFVRSQYRQAAKDIAKQMEFGRSKYDEGIRDQVKSFKKLTFINKLSDWNSNFLSAEDNIFKNVHFKHSLAMWMQSNNIDLETATEEDLKPGIELAMRQALKNTYNDVNAFSQFVSKMKNGHPFVQVLVGGVMPFTNVPANILKIGEQYSPFGVINAIAKSVAIRNDNKVGNAPRYQTTDVIDSVAQSITGTGLMALGWFLYNAGFITLKLGDDDKLKEQEGYQSFAIQIGEYTYTLDWAAPVCLPFFVGAALAKAFEDDGLSGNDVTSALSAIFDPVFEMSMMSGINNAISAAASARYGDVQPITAGFENILEGYVTQGLPTLGGVIASAFDNTRRSIYIDKNSWMPSTLQYILQRSAQKIPGLSNLLVPKTDMWGENVKAASIFERLLSPGYLNKIDVSDVEAELEAVYDVTGNSSVVPTDPQKKLTYTAGGEQQTKNFTAQEYTTYKQTLGKMEFELLSELFDSKVYQNADASKKVNMINQVYTFAKSYAKYEMLSADGVDIAMDKDIKRYKATGKHPVKVV